MLVQSRLQTISALQVVELLEGREDAYAQRAYMVRRLYGCGPRVYLLRGKHESRARRFAHGVVVVDSSLTDALEEADRLVHDRCA